MLRMKKVSETANVQVYLDTGDYFGDVEEAVIIENKIDSWKIKATKDSFLNKVLTGAKGVYVPHQLVKSIGEGPRAIMLVSRAAAPTMGEEN